MRFITYWEALGQVLQKIGINNTKPDGKIAWAVFFIAAATGGVAKFNNKMRLVGQNSNFYKMNNSYKRNEVTG
jgi:hypothetical protein